MSKNLHKFVDSHVISILRNSTTYKHVIKSQDHQDFRDITIKQWDTVAASILCYLKSKYKKEFLFTQDKLLTIARLASVEILKEEGKYKSPTNKCLTDSV